jgi:tRNA pseudouridine13 synthase
MLKAVQIRGGLLANLKNKLLTTVATMDYSMNGEGAVEKLLGISIFANSASGFQGIMKQRYSDFVVREVGLGGECTALKDLSPSSLESLHFNQNSTKISDTENNTNEQLVSNVITEMTAITGGKFGGATAGAAAALNSESPEEELKQFLFLCLEKSDDCPSCLTACPCPDKPSRTKLHQIIRKYLSSCIESEALEISGEKFILLRCKHKMEKGTSGDWRSRNKWPANLGNYLQFTLFKENIDSMSAAHAISKALVSKVDSIQFAGTKDKRAVTAQKVTMYRRKPSDLAKMNRFHLPPYIRVGDFEYVQEPLRLGALSGNNFGIIMRDIDAPSEDIKSACAAIGDSGFINFFGLQRFGSGGTKSHHSGLALLRRDWKLFVEMLFAPREGDRQEVSDVKAAFHRKDYKEALRINPARMPAERSVLESLVKEPEDFEGAFSRVPKNQWLMCLHAYQSYIWNKAASERIRKYGMACIVGDLVAICDANSKISLDMIIEDECDAEDLQQVTGAHGTLPESAAADFGEEEVPVDTAIEKSSISKKAEIHVITADDIAANTYSIHNVVLPLAGHSVVLPENDIGQYIKDLLAEDNLSLEFFAKCQPVEHRMNGAYRQLMEMPKDFEWHFFEYSDPNEELVPTEGSYLRKISQDKTKKRGDKSNFEIPLAFSLESKPYPITNLLGFATAEVPGKYGPGDGTEEEIIVKPKASLTKLKGLQLKFTLPPGTYATMMLREITKHSTNSQYQTQLTASAATAFGANEASAAFVSTLDCVEVESSEAPMKKSRVV